MEECPICWNIMEKKKTVFTICNHTFHRECLNKWLKINKNCPICRNILPTLPIKIKIQDSILQNLNISTILRDSDDEDEYYFRDSIDEYLRDAAEHGHLEVVKILIENGADIHSENDYLLQMSAGDGHLDIVKLLLDSGADVQAQDDFPLRIAVHQNHLEIVRVLLEYGADVNAEDSEALRDAATNGHLSIVKLLLENGANNSAEYDYSALVYAAENGHLPIVKLLLENGADINAEDYSALRISLKNNHFDIAGFLLDNGAKFNFSTIDDTYYFDFTFLAIPYIRMDIANFLLDRIILSILQYMINLLAYYIYY